MQFISNSMKSSMTQSLVTFNVTSLLLWGLTDICARVVGFCGQTQRFSLFQMCSKGYKFRVLTAKHDITIMLLKKNNIYVNSVWYCIALLKPISRSVLMFDLNNLCDLNSVNVLDTTFNIQCHCLNFLFIAYR